MKSSCIEHPANEPLILIRKWQYEFCDGNTVAASIIGILHLAHIEEIELSLPATVTDLHYHLMKIYSINTVRDAVFFLRDHLVIVESEWTDSEALGFIRSKTKQNIIGWGYKCEWCNGKTLKLHEHHFPIKKCNGGDRTVKICPNCHYEFHYLTENKFYYPTDRLLGLFIEHPLPSDIQLSTR